MVNRACDFCSNSYRKNPQAGYFRVTQTMRAVLGLRDQENTQQDFVCGLHFPEDCFLADGRLKAGSVPSFFPYLAAAEHDHTYNQPGTTESPEYDGGNYLVEPKGKYKFKRCPGNMNGFTIESC